MIHVLEKHVADKIAAGEVIDRPVSIIKELVENSIDAGADQITVEIRNGGKSYIRVTDNGCGIEAEDMEKAFLRHATSKISSVKDLDSIGTLGFRGEALASICAVARVDLISKTADAKMGRRVVTEGSEILANEGIGCPEGTTVTVRDLFYNVPARQKFLSSDNGESRRIIDMVSRIALAYGDVRFTLLNGRKQVFTTRGKGNVFDSIVSVYGSDVGRDLLPVERIGGDMIVKGFVSAPSASANSRSRQIFCVNGRVISSKVLEKALDEAYKEKLFHGRFPIAFLFLYIPPEKLDVNIHPTKKEIRFDDDFEVHDFIVKAVRQALEARESLPQVRGENIRQVRERDAAKADTTVAAEKGADTFSREVGASWRAAADDSQTQGSSKGQEDKTPVQVEEEKHKYKPETAEKFAERGRKFQAGGAQVDIKNVLSSLRGKQQEQKKERSFSEETGIKTEQKSGSFDFQDLNYLGSIFDTYIMACDSDCFYLIDQHAAHERVFYEKLRNQYESQEKVSQTLMLPLQFHVAAYIAQSEEDWIDKIRAMGYAIEDFGNKTYIVREIPAFMELEEAESFLNDLFQELEEKPDLTNQKVLDRIIMRSCKSAVKGGDHLEAAEIDALVRDLGNCVNPFSCPHGRPTFIRMTRYEIEKMFKRV